MSLTFRAVYENGVLTPLEQIPLRDNEEVQVTLEQIQDDGGDGGKAPGKERDPLGGIRSPTGISDLSTHFDDYRFGRRK